MTSRFLRALQIGLFAGGLAICAARGQTDAPPKLSMATPDRWENGGWWPTKGTPSFSEYVGPDVCTRCHSQIAASQRLTPMFNAAHRPSDASLHKRKELRFEDETYNYVLSRPADDLQFTIR